MQRARLAKAGARLHTAAMDIAARRDDPAIDELARSIYALFPRCMKCGEAIASYEEADVRVLTHRVVHRVACTPSVQEGSGRSTGMPGDG